VTICWLCHTHLKQTSTVGHKSPTSCGRLLSKMKKLMLTKTQTKVVTDLVHASTSPQCVVLRGNLILEYAQSGNKSQVATKYAVGRDTVRRWCERWQKSQSELDRLEAEYL